MLFFVGILFLCAWKIIYFHINIFSCIFYECSLNEVIITLIEMPYCVETKFALCKHSASSNLNNLWMSTMKWIFSVMEAVKPHVADLFVVNFTYWKIFMNNSCVLSSLKTFVSFILIFCLRFWGNRPIHCYDIWLVIVSA